MINREQPRFGHKQSRLYLLFKSLLGSKNVTRKLFHVTKDRAAATLPPNHANRGGSFANPDAF